MKVILTRDVKDTGRAHEMVEVRDGHALNFLIPKGYAVTATGPAMKIAAVRKKADMDRRALDAKLVEERVAALADHPVTIKKKANERGHLYDAVDAAEIGKAAQIPADAITLDHPIKELGTHEIPVSYRDQFGKFSIIVQAE